MIYYCLLLLSKSLLNISIDSSLLSLSYSPQFQVVLKNRPLIVDVTSPVSNATFLNAFSSENYGLSVEAIVRFSSVMVEPLP